MSGLRVLVCGGRDYNDREKAFSLIGSLNPTLIIEGGASGADKLARLWAARTTTDCDTYPADWPQGRAAGPRRNAKMLAEGRPDIVLAFPGGAGTADMVRQAKKAGVRVIEVAQ